MISSSEKQRLLNDYRAPINARAAVARAAAGLLIVLGVSLIGLSATGQPDSVAAISSQQAASGR